MAFLSGILFYVYPYYWTFALALLAVSDFSEFIRKKEIIWNRSYKYFIISAVSSWYWIHLWQLSKLSYYKESLVRIGFLYSRLPAGWYTQAVLAASLALFWALNRYAFPKMNPGILPDGSLDKITAGLITGLIVLNQQLITGVQMEFNSHYTPVILFFLVAFFGSLVFLLINVSSFHYGKFLVLFSFILVMGFGIGKVYTIAAGFDSDIYVGGRADDVVSWFLENKIRDKVVYAPSDLGDEINLWTDNYLVYHDGQETQLIPTAELIDRFTYYDLANRRFTENLLEEQTQIFGHTFDAVLQKDNVINSIKARLSGRNFTPATLAEYTKYDFGPMREKRRNPDLSEFIAYLEKYHVDYLVYAKKDRNGIYGRVPGKTVFEGVSYLIKKRG